jgi:hypothetical protein
MKRLLLLMAALLPLWAASPSAQKRHTANVTETMDAGGYTYMKVAEEKQSYWVAVTATPVHVGERVTFAEQMWMPDFKSRALGRTFDRILFATMVRSPGAQMPLEHVKPANAPESVLKKAEGGYSVAEVFAKRAELKGREIRVRGKVTKVSKQIMKRNWVHLEDGTGGPMTDDLVFTTEKTPDLEAGDIVVATGRVETDKDFGYGYFYPVIVEESRFTKAP